MSFDILRYYDCFTNDCAFIVFPFLIYCSIYKIYFNSIITHKILKVKKSDQMYYNPFF